MSSCVRASLALLLLQITAAHVFLDNPAANQVLARQRRHNNVFLEELKPGNLERECIEEICSFEEAQEIHQDMEKTTEFWASYLDGDACMSQPCAHDGVCKDGIGTYTCYCEMGYEGFNCEIDTRDQCEYDNGGCEHFCDIVEGRVKCYCADGYFLGSDNESCESNEPFKCGSIFNTGPIFRNNVTQGNETTSIVTNTEHQDVNQSSFTYHNSTSVLDEEMILNGQDCPPGECPWQALFLNEAGLAFCGGTILNEYIILTAAHCVTQSLFFYVKLGEFNTLVNEGHERVHLVETIIVHNSYRAKYYHNDIALIKLMQPIKFSRFILPACIPESDFAKKVLMWQPYGTISGFDSVSMGLRTSPTLQRLRLPFVDRKTCIESSNRRISPYMFCAGYKHFAKGVCKGDSGGPHVTQYRNTYFITGIMSGGDSCVSDEKYSVFTLVFKYTQWIRETIKALVPEEMASNGFRRTSPIRRLTL